MPDDTDDSSDMLEQTYNDVACLLAATLDRNSTRAAGTLITQPTSTVILACACESQNVCPDVAGASGLYYVYTGFWCPVVCHKLFWGVRVCPEGLWGCCSGALTCKRTRSGL